MKVLGLIAGQGELPRAVAMDARAKGYKVVAVALDSLADDSLESCVDVMGRFNVGKVGKIIEFLKKNNVKETVMAGKVPKSLLYKGDIKLDLKAIKLLFSLKDRRDDSILLAASKELEKHGIRLLDMTDFCSGLLTPEGVLTSTKPSRSEWKDIKFGFKMAKEIGRLDIGQTVVVKEQAVMAVEAIEGTDEAIRRGGRLANGGATVVKVSKPEQDMRFDVPVVGMKTLQTMIEAKIRVLAVEAGKSIFLQRDEFIKEAEEAGITVVGYRG
jgi:hypothetical protein